MNSLSDLLLMLVLGIILVYLVMVAQFQSLKSPFIVMFTIPLAFTGGLFALAMTGKEISVISVVGFVMLCGIIVNNGIVLVDYINQSRLSGMEKRFSHCRSRSYTYASYYDDFDHDNTGARHDGICFRRRHKHDAAHRHCMHRRAYLRNAAHAVYCSRYVRFDE